MGIKACQPDLSKALTAAQSLLGCELIHRSPEGTTSGYIVETEAYMATDAASHSFRGKTPRTEIMFGPAGYLYVYFTYGMHYCVNIVTGSEGIGEAVLIRAIQPNDGIEIMKHRRLTENIINLTNGPAKMAQAMGITKLQNGEYVLGSGPVQLRPGIKPDSIVKAKRIGITRETEKLWRFYIAGSPYVSYS